MVSEDLAASLTALAQSTRSESLFKSFLIFSPLDSSTFVRRSVSSAVMASRTSPIKLSFAPTAGS